MAGLAVKVYGAKSITPPKPADILAQTFCRCLFVCDWEEIVFADDSGDKYKTDFTDFLINRVSVSDTIELKLFRNGQEVADLNDDTYGIYYDGFTVQPLYVGFVVDWYKVFTQLGGGSYQVKGDTTILGVTNTFESRYFRLYPFDIFLADKTIKVESYQTGNILGSEFDFTDLTAEGWYSSIRLNGTFGEYSPEIIEDKFLDLSYRQVQNREEVVSKYKLFARQIPENIYYTMTRQNFLANTMLISSYGLLSTKTYNRAPVAISAFTSNNYTNNGRLNFEIEFTDRVQNIIKRNY